ncbi:MAG: AAA family ATPase [Sphingobacteriales bacterium]|nr:AAA family ATPase [Sphingobacteriales bacterium]
METIGQQNIIQVLRQLNDNLTLWLTESNDGQTFEVLTIKPNSDYQTLLDRLLKNEILPLINQDIDGIQKVIRVDFDAGSKTHYIVYQHLDGFQPIYSPTVKALKHLLTGLDQLKKQNRFGFVISDETIMTNQSGATLRFVGLFELFKQQNLLNKEFIAPELLDEKTRPNFQSDIYSTFVCFTDLLKTINDETLKEIFAKSLSEKRTSRFSKYSEILDELEKVKVSANAIHKSGLPTIKVVVKQEERERFLPTLSEMNNSCFFLLDKNLSEGKGQITGMFSTKNYSGRFFADTENHIFIPVQHIKNSPLQKVIQQGFTTELGFDFQPTKYFDTFRYFYDKWETINTISQLNQTKHDLVKKWQTLPDQEREFIEETAFKAAYTEREESKNNPSNIRFTLTDEFRNWDKLKELKRNDINLSIDDKIIGKIQDYNPSDCFLVIKDAKVTVDEIPEKGDLLQDVRMETSQFKKQVEACKKFENKDIVNPELCSILATPERIPAPNRVDIDYEHFKNEVINQNLKTDDTQREAVLEAMHYKPVFLIQGPPGTGKTTVIVELIQQIINQNSNAKILVTSQSNLAVDNVLERLPENILFMRLAADEDRISNEIKEHSFQSKLKHWVKDTQENSTGFFNEHFQSKIKDKALVNFHNFYSNINREGETAFGSFANLLRMQPQYIKGLFEKAKNIKDVENIFSEKLGKEFQQLKKIQKDWFAFLSNSDTDEGNRKKSMLNDGSTEIDLRTAFVKSVNVIGATCIHIASSQYSKINFRFDYVIMDESSKASPAETLVPINMGHNIILIGDHKQLPPVITREEAVKQKVKEKLEDNGLDIEKEFGESLFEKLITEFEANPNLQSYIRMLDIQYRMPRQIGNLISRFFYDGKLKNPDTSLLKNFDKDKFHELKLKKATASIFDTVSNAEIEVPNSVIFVSTSKQKNPNDNDNKFFRQNECNKNSIKEILKQLNKLYPDNLKREKPFTIGVIAGYRGQVNLLQDSIELLEYKNFVAIDEEGKPEPLIEINTVDKFQGAERDIIIYDIVKSSKGSSPIGFLDDYRRINVAFSRVKRLLIVVGDSEYILKRATLNPSGKFKEFKLKEIVAELDRQGVIVHSLNEMIQ